MKKTPRPKWELILDRWGGHHVPLIEVRKFDRLKHLPGVAWIDKDADEHRNSYYVITNPQQLTARHLTEGIVTGSEEIFAAFALHAFTVSKDFPYRTDVGSVAWEVLHRLDPRPGPYWTANSKNIFINPDGWYVSYKQREEADWKELVDLAARFWTLLANKFAIVRIPDLMDWKSEEYREWQRYAERRHEETERREYERLRKKFEDRKKDN